MLNHESLEPTIPVVLGRWGITAPERVSPVPGGTLNWNFDVRTATSRFFLRCYRANLESERIVWADRVGSVGVRQRRK